MTASRNAAKFALLIVIAAAVLAGCQGVYVGGDVGPHSTRETSRFTPATANR